MVRAPTLVTGERCRRSPQRPTLGFTLLELMLVVAIIALIAASLPMAVSRWLPARRLEVATQRLISDVRWLQAHATASGSTGYLQVTATGYVLRIPQAKLQRSVVLPKPLEIEVESGQLQVQFYAEGATSGGRLDVSDGRRRQQVDVSAMTGRVRRLEPRP